jgi:hypothetical protein
MTWLVAPLTSRVGRTFLRRVTHVLARQRNRLMIAQGLVLLRYLETLLYRNIPSAEPQADCLKD